METLIAGASRRLATSSILRSQGPSATAAPVRYMAAAATATSTTPRRTTYSRVKPATASGTTFRRTAPAAAAAAAPTPRAEEEAPLPDFSADDFIMPQPAAELPDYAALAPSAPAEAAYDLPTPPKPAPGKPSGLTGRGFPGEQAVAMEDAYDWSNSFHGLSAQPFSKEIAERLMRPLTVDDIELKPDGLLYLPEIKYRRTLNEAFGPGGWGLAPRGETNVDPRIVSREWGLVCLGRLVAIARGEQEYFDPSGIPTATEACKSNALMRCCKDLGIASELWDPTFIKQFKKEHCVEAFVEHVVQTKKRKLWRKKNEKFEYPYKEA